MNFTYILEDKDLDGFNENDLSKYERYIFIVLMCDDDLSFTLKLLRHKLAASKYLVLVITQQSMPKLLLKQALQNLLEQARTLGPIADHSFVASISREAAISSSNPGLWQELFLSLEPTLQKKKEKLVQAVEYILKNDKEKTYSTNTLIPKILFELVKALSRTHG